MDSEQRRAPIEATTDDVAATAGRANHRMLRAHLGEFAPKRQGLTEHCEARKQSAAQSETKRTQTSFHAAAA